MYKSYFNISWRWLSAPKRLTDSLLSRTPFNPTFHAATQHVLFISCFIFQNPFLSRFLRVKLTVTDKVFDRQHSLLSNTITAAGNKNICIYCGTASFCRPKRKLQQFVPTSTQGNRKTTKGRIVPKTLRGSLIALGSCAFK